MANAPTPGSPPTPLRVAGAAVANRALHARSVGLNAKYGLPKTRDIYGTPPKPPKGPAVKAPAAKAPVTDPYTAQAMAMVNPEVLALQQQQKFADQQNLAYQGQLTNFYKALGGLLQGQAPAVSAAYNSAANAVGGLAQGLTGDARTQMDAQNANAQAILARGGQTQASDYMAGKATPGDAALNPFYSVHGLIPGTTLATQGAAYAANAAAPGIWAARGGDALTEAISKAVQGDEQWQQKIADVYAKVPALRQQILQTAQDMELKQRQIHDTEVALGIKDKQVRVDAVKAQQAYQAHMASVRLQAQKLNAQIANWNAQLQNQALDRQTRIELQQMRDQAMQQRIQLQTQAKMTYAQWAKANGISTSGSGSSSTGSWSKVSAAITKQAKYYQQHPSTPAVKDPFGKVKTPAGYGNPQTIFNALWSSYVNPYLQTVPANQRATARSTAKRAVLNAMAAAGLPLPKKK